VAKLGILLVQLGRWVAKLGRLMAKSGRWVAKLGSLVAKSGKKWLSCHFYGSYLGSDLDNYQK
jgi:hypothetical protein